MRIIGICPVCKKEFKMIPSKLKICCSVKCGNNHSSFKCNKIKKDNNAMKKEKIKKDFLKDYLIAMILILNHILLIFIINVDTLMLDHYQKYL